ncbi:MAG: hypothetical protein ACLRWC_00545 [Acutalibacter sp.]
MSEQKIPARSELDPQYTWATTDLYPSDEAWEADIPKVQAAIDGLRACQGTLGQSAQGLLKFLQLEDEFTRGRALCHTPCTCGTRIPGLRPRR